MYVLVCVANVVTDARSTDILKQQGHYFDMNTLAYSPEGQYIATGGQDAKLKVWNASTGFCFVTFKGRIYLAPLTGY